MKKYTLIITIAIIIILVCVIILIKGSKKYVGVNSNIYNNENVAINEIDELVHNKENKTIVNEGEKEPVESKSTETILSVNGENISKDEIDFVNIQLNNEFTSDNDLKNKSATEKIVEECVIVQNAKEIGKELTEEESKQIENKAKERLKERYRRN